MPDADEITRRTVDEPRGILCVPIGGPAANYWGGDRPGSNLYANSIVAVDAESGKIRWHFQTVHHNLWDSDMPCAYDSAIAAPHAAIEMLVTVLWMSWSVEQRGAPQLIENTDDARSLLMAVALLSHIRDDHAHQARHVDAANAGNARTIHIHAVLQNGRSRLDRACLGSE